MLTKWECALSPVAGASNWGNFLAVKKHFGLFFLNFTVVVLQNIKVLQVCPFFKLLKSFDQHYNWPKPTFFITFFCWKFYISFLLKNEFLMRNSVKNLKFRKIWPALIILFGLPIWALISSRPTHVFTFAIVNCLIEIIELFTVVKLNEPLQAH